MRNLIQVFLSVCVLVGVAAGVEDDLRARADELTRVILTGEHGEYFAEDLVEELIASADDLGTIDRNTALALGRAIRLATLFDGLGPSRGEQARELFVEDPTLRDEFLFALVGDDVPERAFTMLWRLVEHDANEVGRHPRLACSISVVRDGFDISMTVNENEGVADSATDVFDYFVRNQSRLNIPSESLPIELLIYVVDAPASVAEMEWALDRYRGDQQVGRRFFDIKYDNDHALRGEPKASTEAGWGLPAIRQYGGVCADQTYFAMMVGKAIGVPAVYTRGRSGDVSHAWVGFLESRGGKAWWNFDTGRYKSYKGVRGVVVNPQTGLDVNDSSVALLGMLVGLSAENRRESISFTDIAELIGRGPDRRPPGSPEIETQLALLKSAVNAAPGLERPWRMVADLAERGELTFEQKKGWSEAVIRMCGATYPDFVFDLLKPMISTVADTKAQDKLWRAAAKITGKRKDLAAEVKLAQGQMWEDAGDRQKAWVCYDDVVTRYVNDTPLAFDAISKMKSMLKAAGMDEEVVPLYKRVWRQTSRPKYDSYFTSSSNYARLGHAYESALRSSGNTAEADRVERIISGK